MHYEFIGSLIVFAMIPVLNGLRGGLAGILFMILFLSAFYINVYMCSFVMGCFLSYYRCQIADHKSILPLNRPVLFFMLVLVVLAFGYTEPGKGFYSFMLMGDPGMMRAVRILIHSLAAIIIIEIILNHKTVYALFDSRIGRFLGRCSFALYVIHVPLIFSFSCYVFLKLLESLGYRLTVLVTLISSTLLLFIVSWLLTLVDEAWCRFVNRNVKKLV
jgi:peptidoglycan/LPS O-acetylase OafA/YrhL